MSRYANGTRLLGRLYGQSCSFLVAVLTVLCVPLSAQTFDSGSNGSDGALNLTTPGVVLFDPTSSDPPLDPDGDNIYHFTTINIGPGVTVKLSGAILSGPVYWLAADSVQINGTIDLDGANGYDMTLNVSDRVPSLPGAGGYAGGVGGNSTSFPPQPGNGPGGGTAAAVGNGTSGGPGNHTGNQFLIPLIGGSGGGGSGRTSPAVNSGSGGGAGGGAILIASSTTIAIDGSIVARGGNGGSQAPNDPRLLGGPGSGGAVRLVANTISGSGALHASGGTYVFGLGVSGRVRLEANSNSFNGVTNPQALRSVPFALLLPSTPPSSIRVTSINGMPINANPFTFPDAVINSTSPVTVSIEARFVPIGTVPTLTIFSETGGDQTIDCTPLIGTLDQSNSTASITFPAGGSRGFVKATWTQ